MTARGTAGGTLLAGNLSAGTIAHPFYLLFAGPGTSTFTISSQDYYLITFVGAGASSLAAGNTYNLISTTFAGASALAVNTFKPISTAFVGSSTLTLNISYETFQAPVPFGFWRASPLVNLAEAGFASFAYSVSGPGGGVGSLALNALLAQAGYATFAGYGSVAVNATQISAGGTVWQGTSVLVGASTESINVNLNEAAFAEGDGAGSLAAGTVKVDLAELLPGTGVLSAQANLVEAASINLVGAGLEAAQPQLAEAAFATLNGSSSLTAVDIGKSVTALFNGASILVALTFDITTDSFDLFTGVGSASALTFDITTDSAELLPGAGTLAVNATQISAGGTVWQGTAVLAGTGNLASTLFDIITDSAELLAGAGLQAAQPQLAEAASANLTAASALAATDIGKPATALFGGTSVLVALTFSITTDSFELFSGAGNLASTVTDVEAALAAFTGIGGLASDTSQTSANPILVANAGVYLVVGSNVTFTYVPVVPVTPVQPGQVGQGGGGTTYPWLQPGWWLPNILFRRPGSYLLPAYGDHLVLKSAGARLLVTRLPRRQQRPPTPRRRISLAHLAKGVGATLDVIAARVAFQRGYYLRAEPVRLSIASGVCNVTRGFLVASDVGAFVVDVSHTGPCFGYIGHSKWIEEEPNWVSYDNDFLLAA